MSSSSLLLRYLLSVVFLFSISSSQLAWADSDDDELNAEWANAKISQETYLNLIRNGSCENSENEFFGCIKAAEALLNQIDEDKEKKESLGVFIRADAVENEIKRFGNLVILKREEIKNDSAVKAFQIALARSRAEKAELAAAYQTPSLRTQTPFLDLTLYAFDQAKTKSHLSEKVLASIALNKFYELPDPHAELMTAATLKKMMQGEPELFGIGASLKKISKKCMIFSVLDSSPALAAKLQARDFILKVNGEPTDEISLDQIVKKVRGPEGTEVTLTIQRKDEIFDITLRRARVAVKNVKSKVEKIDESVSISDSVGIVEVRQFIEGVCKDVEREVRFLEAEKNVKALVLDLRNNPGGLLGEAVCITGLFVGQEVVVIQKPKRLISIPQPVPATNDRITNLPLIVLVNSQSASASEIVSGALQDYERAYILGDRTFGKGTVQQIIDLDTEGLYMKKTTAFYLLPSRRSPQLQGISPDFLAYRNQEASDLEQIGMREEDLYWAPLELQGNPVYQQKRPGLIKALSDCMAKKGKADTLWEKIKEAGNAELEDYQDLKAKDLVACLSDPS